MTGFILPSPFHNAAMQRYHQTLRDFEKLDPPLTLEEKKHILDACLTGGNVVVRCNAAVEKE